MTHVRQIIKGRINYTLLTDTVVIPGAFLGIGKSLKKACNMKLVSDFGHKSAGKGACTFSFIRFGRTFTNFSKLVHEAVNRS